MNRTKIKICGIKTQQDIVIMNRTKPDYAGFVFFEKSKRHLTYDQAADLLANLDHGITPVAVCVSPDSARIEAIVRLGFPIIQIHGNLTNEMIEQWPNQIWQAVNVDGEDLPKIMSHPKIVGYVVDGAKYGSGQSFAWSKELAKACASLPHLILAGGLNAENVCEGIQLFQPDIVDVSSGVELPEMGKDAAKVEAFIRSVREGA